jgi:predicted nicotinamide N-methyase
MCWKLPANQPVSDIMDLPFNPPQHPELTARIRRVLKNGKIISSPLPLTPEIRLYLLNPDYPQHSLTGEEIQDLMKEPPFWSFCWSSGQVLARWIMEREDLVKGRDAKQF